MARSAFHFVGVGFNLLSLILLCLVIFAGFHNGLHQLYWLKTDNTNFKAPSKLSTSPQLKDLGDVSNTNLIGSDATAASLGLPDWSGVNLLTECGKFSDGHVECSKPKIGFWFRPDEDLKVATTALQGKASQQLLDALNTYSKGSRYIEWSFIVAAFCALGAPLESFISPLLSSITCAFATLLLSSATIAAAVIFKKLSDAFNEEFDDYGLQSSTGAVPIALGFIAAAGLVVSTIGYIISYRRGSRGPQRNKRGVSARSVGGKEGGLYSDEYPGAAAQQGAGGIWNRGNHKYVPIEEQGGALAQNQSHARDVEAPDLGRRLDDDWAAPDEYSNAGAGQKTSSGPASIPMVSLGGNKGTKDLNTAYEPYTSGK
ncbi:MAGE-like protein 2 [Podospora australis]|uniref:MAGE-like protein 2 n=1 Tax=Podospora australis TaxID=1536484 RepID=A0AAN7AJA5_9PEZI|nr:MAGE-like protein 2 [Podospora australis]